MTPNQATQTAIAQALPWLLPPRGVIHLGVGSGTGPMHQWRTVNVDHALLIDANLQELHWVREALEENLSWLAEQVIVAAEDGQIIFHCSNNPMESGICSPQTLSAFWPNLSTAETQTLPTLSLDTLVKHDSHQAIDYDWLCVDFLPALSIVKGCQRQLDKTQVLWLRVTRQVHATLPECSLDEAETYLNDKGFRCALVVEENHPAFASALFLRDWPKALGSANDLCTQLHNERDAARTLAENHRAKNEQLAGELILRAKLAQDRQAEIDTLTANRNTQAKLAAERQQQIDQLTQGRDEQTRIAQERQARIEALAADRDTLARTATERQEQLDQLTSQRDEARRRMQQQQDRLQALEAEGQETEMRQQLLQEELVKAEAQLELIKDLLLREPGL